MMVNGKLMKHMDMEFIFMKMVQPTKENGLMIYKMAKDVKNGQMEGMYILIIFSYFEGKYELGRK